MVASDLLPSAKVTTQRSVERDHMQIGEDVALLVDHHAAAGGIGMLLGVLAVRRLGGMSLPAWRRILAVAWRLSLGGGIGSCSLIWFLRASSSAFGLGQLRRHVRATDSHPPAPPTAPRWRRRWWCWRAAAGVWPRVYFTALSMSHWVSAAGAGIGQPPAAEQRQGHQHRQGGGNGAVMAGGEAFDSATASVPRRGPSSSGCHSSASSVSGRAPRGQSRRRRAARL